MLLGVPRSESHMFRHRTYQTHHSFCHSLLSCPSPLKQKPVASKAAWNCLPRVSPQPFLNMMTPTGASISVGTNACAGIEATPITLVLLSHARHTASTRTLPRLQPELGHHGTPVVQAPKLHHVPCRTGAITPHQPLFCVVCCH